MTLVKAIARFEASNPGLLKDFDDGVVALLRGIEEPTEEQCAVAMMVTLGAMLGKHHGDDEMRPALFSAARLLLAWMGETP